MAKKWLDRIGSNKSRTLILLALVILFVIIVVTIFSIRKPNPLKTDESRTTKIPQITAIPGGATSEKYQELQEADNKRIAEQAKKKGGSAIATIIGNKDNDLLAKKESFGIEGEFLKAGECKCPPPTTTATKPTCPKDLEFALKSIINNKEAAKKMLTECPAMAKLLAEKNPALFKQLMLENPELAKLIADTSPEVIKKLMESDTEFARQLGKTNPTLVKNLMMNDPTFADKMAKANPEMVKALMVSDPNFADKMAKANPDMVKALMDNDPNFAKALLQKMPGLMTITDKQRLEALEEARRKERESQTKRAKQTQLSELQQKQLAALMISMEAQSKTAFDTWNTITPQAFVQGDKKDSKDDTGKASNGGKNGTAGGGASDMGKVLIKAGSILFAVLDTAINTDEPGPIMATIVQGEFQGAKVIGSTQLSSQPGNDRPEKVTLNFSTMSTPRSPKSLTIQGVAIDTDTARTALASDVDHHYLLRYGTLFASSFMNGYAKAITSQGVTQTNSGTGTTSTTTPMLSGRKEVLAALGEVGKKFGDATSTYFTTPNTITVDAGTGIGLLILSDVTATQ